MTRAEKTTRMSNGFIYPLYIQLLEVMSKLTLFFFFFLALTKAIPSWRRALRTRSRPCKSLSMFSFRSGHPANTILATVVSVRLGKFYETLEGTKADILTKRFVALEYRYQDA
ncbi:hypothetical protein V8F33_006987 [Rhypophila sp. PSN 637]